MLSMHVFYDRKGALNIIIDVGLICTTSIMVYELQFSLVFSSPMVRIGSE